MSDNNDRFLLPLKTEYLDGQPANPVFTRYESLGTYMNFANLGVLSWKIVKDDGDGIPINTHHGKQEYNPVTIAHYALELYSKIVTSPADDLNEKLDKVIAWCLKNQDAQGGWKFDFNHMFFKGRTETIVSPWYSALSQGMMISALARYGHLRGIDLSSNINRSLSVINMPVSDGGVKRVVFGHHPFFEEYPTNPPSLVLNGFMFCLLGLYDAWTINRSAFAKELFLSGMQTLGILLPLYDLGSGSAYDLTHYTTGVEGPNKARPAYHRLHVAQLSTLSSTGHGKLTRIVNRWHQYLMGNQLQTN